MKNIDDIIKEARERAIQQIGRELAYNAGYPCTPMIIDSIRGRIEVGELHLSEERPLYKSLRWYENERAAYLEGRVVHSMRVLQDEQVTHTKSEESIPRDPFSHLLLWLAGKTKIQWLCEWLMRYAKTRTIHTVTNRSVKLFLPPWPLKRTDKPYLEWVSAQQRRKP